MNFTPPAPWRKLVLVCAVVIMATLVTVAMQGTAYADDPAGTDSKSSTPITFPSASTADSILATAKAAQEETTVCELGIARDELPVEDGQRMDYTACVNGMAGQYPCSNVDLMSYLPLASIGGGGTIRASSIWGWTDPVTSREYALIGLRDKTSIIDITDAANAFYIGNLPTHTGTSSWRELKSYNNHMYVVSDSNGEHGVQVLDLTQLRNYQTPPTTPVVFEETNVYSETGSIHNIWVNEATGYAYAVGSRTGGNTCNAGLHMIDLEDPANPTFAGCFDTGEYIHDVECVVYEGPDTDYTGHEICVAARASSSTDDDAVVVIDVTDKSNPTEIGRTQYPGRGYTHQGSLTPDQQYMVVDDELDEEEYGHVSRTYVWDMRDLNNPTLIDYHDGATPAIDHNQYIIGDRVFQANYRAGFRYLDGSDIPNGNLTEIGYFDIYPANDLPQFNAAWGIYPYFPSGNVIISGIEQGLFVLRPTENAPTAIDVGTVTSTGATNFVIPAIAGVALLGLAGVGVAIRRRK